jgi:hypothetical protein
MAANTRSVAELCRDCEVTVEQLIEKSGLEDTRVKAIILGRWTPSPTERRSIASVFDVSIDDITWGHLTPIQHIYGTGPG